MSEAQVQQQGNPLGYEKVSKLLPKFAIPSVLAMVVNALYNIVDQIFIGQGVGVYGNAATNVAFPLTTVCVAVALLFGTGCASRFSLELGAGRKDEATKVIGNTLVYVSLAGLLLMVGVQLFLRPLMIAFGATDQVLELAMTYTRITGFGIPFVVYTTASSHIIRADGSPRYSMLCILTGAILNTILDPIFIFVFDMGIAGAALATTLSQIVGFLLAFAYLFRFKQITLTRADFKLSPKILRIVTGLGASSCFNQLSLLVVQVTMNNSLTYYGAQSVYGPDIPLAVAGISMKVFMMFLSVVIGIAQGAQPIVGYNYGAGNFGRVKQAFKLAVGAATVVSVIGFLCFQLFPRQIIGIFGSGSEEYFHFGERYLRIYMLATCLNGLQPVSGNFFTAIGKPLKGIFISMTRQIIFLVPLILILPIFLGIDGIMYAGPVADTVAFLVALGMIYGEFKKMNRNEVEALDL